MFGFFRNRRRRKLRAAPLPPAWLEILEKNSLSFIHCDELTLVNGFHLS